MKMLSKTKSEEKHQNQADPKAARGDFIMANSNTQFLKDLYNEY